MKKILLEGYFGFGNIGDEALCTVLIKELEEIYSGNVEIFIMSRNPKQTSLIQGKKSIFDSNSFIKYFIEISRIDVLIFCGGARSGDSTHRKIAILSLMAKILGKRVEFRSIGFNSFPWRGNLIIKVEPKPITNFLNRFLLKLALTLVDRLTVRDEFSRKSLYLSGIKRKIGIEKDLGLKLKPLSLKEIKHITDKYGINPQDKVFRIGINLRTLTEDINMSSIDFILKSLDFVMEEFPIEVVLIPFGYGSIPTRFFDNDITVLERLKEKSKRNLKLIDVEIKPSEMLTLFGLFDIVIGMRFHSIIFASIMKVPVVSLIYDVKIEEFLKSSNRNNHLLGIYIADLQNKHILWKFNELIQESASKKTVMFS
jgi:polysaccharide pyruvyl transferase WcaK-like protein